MSKRHRSGRQLVLAKTASSNAGDLRGRVCLTSHVFITLSLRLVIAIVGTS